MSEAYLDFLRAKVAVAVPTGLTTLADMPASMFDHQQALCRWALKRGRAAIFADTGLGKSRMQIEWADQIHKATGLDVIILAPLAVAAQTVTEGAQIGVTVTLCREACDVRPGINITNYDRMHKFDLSRFGAVVLDESSCIKHHDAKTLKRLLDAFRDTPFKLCATATPAPNDWTELGTHAEFLGICSRVEMLSEYFVHDGGETQVWRLKGHGRVAFWRWVASWAAMVRKPSDLGFDDSRYILPPLHVEQHIVPSSHEDANEAGMLFKLEAQTLSERRDARRATIEARVNACVELVRSSWTQSENANTTEPTESQIGTGYSQSDASDMRRTATESESGHATTRPIQSTRPVEKKPQDDTVKTPLTSDASTCASATSASETSSSPRTRLAGRAPSKAERSEIGSCAENSALDSPTTNACSSIRAAGARSAEQPCQAMERDFALTTATQQGSLGASSVARATSESASSKTHHHCCGEPPRTSKTQWIVWCMLNAEQDAIASLLGDDCVSIFGSLSPEEKVDRYERFARGEVAVLVTKPSIFGYGVNMQFSSHAAFVGVDDSFESYYQTIRRQWRFGQTNPVHVHLFASELEGAVLANLQRKERDAAAMAESLSAETHDAVNAEVFGVVRDVNPYEARQRVSVPAWLKTEVA